MKRHRKPRLFLLLSDTVFLYSLSLGCEILKPQPKCLPVPRRCQPVPATPTLIVMSRCYTLASMI